MTSIHRLAIHPTKGRGRWVCVAGGSGHGEVTVWDIEKAQCREVYRGSGEKDIGKGYDPWRVDEENSETTLSRYSTQLLDPLATGNLDRGIRSIAIGVDTAEDGRDPKNSVGFLITTGQDRKLKYWDLSKIESSFVFSGMSLDEPKPIYSASQPTFNLILNTERPGQPSDRNAQEGSRKNKAPTRQSRSTIISQQQQQLLKSHLDSILDVSCLNA